MRLQDCYRRFREFELESIKRFVVREPLFQLLVISDTPSMRANFFRLVDLWHQSCFMGVEELRHRPLHFPILNFKMHCAHNKEAATMGQSEVHTKKDLMFRADNLVRKTDITISSYRHSRLFQESYSFVVISKLVWYKHMFMQHGSHN